MLDHELQELNATKSLFLFEVSWEVCNKVGGIYTVLRSKLKEVIKNFGNNYILIGPLLPDNRHFIETTTDNVLENIKSRLQQKGLYCRVGYWDTEGKPKVILIDYQNRYKIDELLYKLWLNFGIDSLASNFEYIEPLLFATACGEVIQTITDELLPRDYKVIAHFHEWLCGAGLLYLKLNAPNIATVFTTHATVLGRSLAHSHHDIYNLPINFDPNAEARLNGVFAKHSLEYASAREASCFTTVSAITGEETYMVLNKFPDKIVLNGLDIEKIQQSPLPDNISSLEARQKLLDIARKVTHKNISENGHIWITSGRYEFHNKGFDVLIKSLAKLDKKLNDSSRDIVVFFLVAAAQRSKHDSMLEDNLQLTPTQRNGLGIATHKIDNPDDPIIKLCTELDLIHNSRKIHIIFCDAYLGSNDGVFDLHYETVLSGCDLSIFPSYYEPWGYTPLESIAYGVPTITTDLAGFGCWVKTIKEDYRDAIYLLEYRGKEQIPVIETLSDQLGVIAHQDPKRWDEVKNKAKIIANLADWKIFYNDYLDAYAQAVEFNAVYYAKFGLETEDYVTSYHEETSVFPRFRSFQYECQLPEKLTGLRDLAYNMWWCWHDHIVVPIFKEIDPELWKAAHQNPVRFINSVSTSLLQKKSNDTVYMKKYTNVINAFNAYMQDEQKPEYCEHSLINKTTPIAYFCLEYGLDECLPIYSGGLGILAGDYLKTISDLNIPMIAIGMFYRQGYFIQKISSQGEQVVTYTTENPNQLPMHQMSDASGEPLLINLELLDRTIYLSVWEVKVGRVSLYLLDSDLTKNSPEDRQITGRLYGGSREYRLMQEIILGVGGARFIVEQLKIVPSIYHLNEGHSAFLLLERLKELYNQGRSPMEAYDLVRTSSVFTTHTSVPAGNEVFADEMLTKYFAKPAKLLGIPVEKLLSIGKTPDNTTSKAFSMTALSLKQSLGINAVSHIHGDVAKSMWKGLWPGLLDNEIPILGITNGVHLPTWLGPEMRLIYDNYLGLDWEKFQNDLALWENIATIPDKAIFEAHQAQKERLLEIVRKRLIKEYTLRNESETLINASLDNLDRDTLVIGLARRFATYKRHYLVLRNKERLAKILTNTSRPVVLLVAGKSHPADGAGQKVVNQIITMLRDPIFNGHVIFLENYDMKIAKALVQGVDIWLNTPIIGTEACGTSGMKVGLNGGLNFSIADGWWAEAYRANNLVGWTIESFISNDADRRDEMENIFLLDILEHEITETYYEAKKPMLSSHWIRMMKAAISHISYQFNTQRMVKDYFEQLYCPVARYHHHLTHDSYKNLKIISEWKKQIGARFSTVKIKTTLVNGIKDGKIKSDGVLKIKVLLFSGKMKAHELQTHLVLIKNDGNKFVSTPIIVPLELADLRESGVLTYTAEYRVEDAGFYAYGVRVLPSHPQLFSPKDVGIALWG